MYTFLVVSNDKSVCNFFTCSLNGECIIYIAKTPEEALQTFLTKEIDIIFLDILLCDDGANRSVELLRRTNTDLMTIMLVPGSQPMLSEEAMRLGAYDFIEKPLRKEVLQYVINRALERQELKRELGFIQSRVKNFGPEEKENRFSMLSAGQQASSGELHFTYKEIFQKFSKVLTQVHDLGRLADMVVDALAEILRVAKVTLILVHKKEGISKLYRCSGFDEATARNVSLNNNQGIILWLMKNHQIMTEDVINRELSTNRLSMREVFHIRKEMNLLQAHVCVPVFASGNLSSVIALGNKITGKPFFDEDIELLSMLARYIGMAVENAFLYQEVNLRRIHNENVLENVPYGIIAINNKCRINTFNKSAASMLNISPDDVIGKDVKYIGSTFANFLLRTLKDRKAYRMEEVVNPLTHSTYEVSTSLLLDKGKELGSIMIFSDLSEVKKLGAKIQDLERLVNEYVINSENSIPLEVMTRAVSNLSKNWLAERQRLSFKQEI